MTTTWDSKPYDKVSHQCYTCGFYSKNQTGFVSFLVLNEWRENMEISQYDNVKLAPKQNEELIN